MKESDRRSKLISLGAENLADSLMGLAAYSDEANGLVERLLASPAENKHRFMQKLARVVEGNSFIGRRGSGGYARELAMMLDDLKAGVEDPLQGLSLMTVFFESDEDILGHCDDSDGNVGDVFRYEGVNLFAHYASGCPDKKQVARLILDLNRKDDYGIRDILVDNAGSFLSKDILRWMIGELQKMAGEESGESGMYHFSHRIESLARQAGDAELFEKTRLASWSNINAAAIIDIARVYHETGDTEKALEWLEKIPSDGTFMSRDRDRLLEEIYRNRGEKEKLSDLLFKHFRSHPTAGSLETLLKVIGEKRREEIVTGAVRNILENPALDEDRLGFLVAMDLIDEAETYLLDRAERIDGDSYYFWPSLAETMEKENRPLAATVIYRSLLVSILDRAFFKAYHYGVDYLKALDEMSGAIRDWRGIPGHREFWLGLKEKHGRKRSFWERYNKEG